MGMNVAEALVETAARAGVERTPMHSNLNSGCTPP